MLNDLRNIIYAILNKESRGELSPTEFNNLVWKVVLDKFNSYLTEYRIAVVKLNRGNGSYGLADQPSQIRQLIDLFSTDKFMQRVNDVNEPYAKINLPDDCAYIEKIAQQDKIISEVEKSNLLEVLGSSKAKPDNNFLYYTKNEDGIRVYPNIQGLTFYYLRFPKRPKWTYQDIRGSVMFNPSASDFQDIELHLTELPDLVMDMCSLLNINLKDYQDLQALEVLKDKKYQKENLA